MSKSIADLTAAIAANTTAAKAVAAAFASAATVGLDFTPQVDAVNANTDTLNALIAPPAATSAITASPASVALASVGGSVTVSLTESNGQPNTFEAVSENTAVATVSPASGAGPFTVTEVAPGATSVSFTDAQGNSILVAVIAS